MYKVCIFDLDGTLADTVESMAVCANRALAKLGLQELPTENFRYYAGDGAAELVKRCLRDSGDTKLTHYDEMLALYKEYFSKGCMIGVTLYNGIPELLEELKRRDVHIAVLSNKPHAQAKDVVAQLFGEGYFDYVQGQREDVPRKPSPIGALRIAEQFAVKPEECLYLGDTDTDMQTGKAAGMYTFGVLWGFRTREELEANHADVIIAHPLEILEYM